MQLGAGRRAQAVRLGSGRMGGGAGAVCAARRAHLALGLPPAAARAGAVLPVIRLARRLAALLLLHGGGAVARPAAGARRRAAAPPAARAAAAAAPPAAPAAAAGLLWLGLRLWLLLGLRLGLRLGRRLDGAQVLEDVGLQHRPVHVVPGGWH
jgi:hypothetical protein